ncbi:hypothetical protein GcC1_162010 [Golovinomyces cichoracearum]|uniref:Uncharacterized protein n=1 Tax=Golovinomyces cichoracearum TaxID=62708 RepID=A0A420HTM0_9PEZI|nr:hypothetical protein GcC1_162010 [Golovinomyces cichoracearum]
MVRPQRPALAFQTHARKAILRFAGSYFAPPHPAKSTNPTEIGQKSRLKKGASLISQNRSTSGYFDSSSSVYANSNQ